MLKKFIPDFNLRIVHSTISIKNLINFHIKPSVDPLATSNVVYRFECECDSVYIGETQQCLRNRIWQHRYRDSHIGKHITKCIPYKAALYETYNKPGGPNVPEKRTFLESHFSILAKNLYNYYDRITVEGTYINNLQPDLNVQVPHKNCKFLCKCLSKPAARADSFPEI